MAPPPALTVAPRASPDLPPEAWARVLSCLRSARDVAGAARSCRAALAASRLASSWSGAAGLAGGGLWAGRGNNTDAALRACLAPAPHVHSASSAATAGAALAARASALAFDRWSHGVDGEWRKARGAERVTRLQLGALAPRLGTSKTLRALSLAGCEAAAQEVARAAARSGAPLCSLALPRCGEWAPARSAARVLNGGQPAPREFLQTAGASAELLRHLKAIPTLRHLRIGSVGGGAFVPSRKNTQPRWMLGGGEAGDEGDESDSEADDAAELRASQPEEELLSVSALLSALSGLKFVEIFTPCVWSRGDEAVPLSDSLVHLVLSSVAFKSAHPGEMAQAGGKNLRSLFFAVAFDSPSPALAASNATSTEILKGSPKLPGLIHLPGTRAVSSMPQAYHDKQVAALDSTVVECMVRREADPQLEAFGQHRVARGDDIEAQIYWMYGLGELA